jgi:tRNA modification GTPase
MKQLKNLLTDQIKQLQTGEDGTIISNLRHVQSLQKAKSALQEVLNGLNNGIPSDLVALDMRHALNALGEISGEISTDDLLESIFRNFCIGK